MIRKIMEKVGSGWLFLMAMLLAYAVVFAFNQQLFIKSVSGFVKIIINILPVLLLVFALIFIVNLFLQPKQIAKYLGKESGAKGWLIAIISGIISTGPIYMWYPMLADLKERGMRTALVAAFLYARAVKIPLLPLMILYFGWTFTILINVYIILFSVINGFLVEKIGG